MSWKLGGRGMTGAVLGIAIGALTLGCAPTIPPLAAGPFGSDDPTVLQRVIDVVTRRGYHAQAIDASDGTFFVTARAEPQTVVTFEVRCTRDGWVLVTPHGEAVTSLDGGYRMRARLRTEYFAFVAALDRELSPRRRPGDRPGASSGDEVRVSGARVTP